MKKKFLCNCSLLVALAILIALCGCVPQNSITSDSGALEDTAGISVTSAPDIFGYVTDPVQNEQHETLTGETDKIETKPIVTAPLITEKTETEPIETGKIETEPSETEVPETTQTETQEPETQPLAPPQSQSTFNIHFIDVGQADSALVECDGHYMLIDGGNKADSNLVYSVLRNADVPKLDIVVATHPHEDHVGGIPGAFNYTTADVTLCSDTDYGTKAFSDFKKYANSKGGGITVPEVGDEYSLGSAKIKILGVNSADDPNNTSIVLMITYGKTKFLFTGDAEREAEQVILNSSVDLSATVLKVGHHGSSSSTTYPFLREIMPEYAVICVGEDNSYGHPTDNTLSRLRDADVTVYRTDMHGDVYCTSDGENVIFSVERNADKDPFGNL